jgi:ribosomal protein L40E
MPARRFPPPWSAEITPNCSIVRDVKAPTSIMKANQVGDRQQSYSAKMRREDREVVGLAARNGFGNPQRPTPATIWWLELPRQSPIHFSNPLPIVGSAGMHIRSLEKFTCRCCGASVEADAGRCYRCGVAYPASELRAVALSPTAIPFYVAALAFIAFWFL